MKSTTKLCDSCSKTASTIFCKVDSAFLCLACDATVHSPTSQPHERVWLCEVCEQAPASVTCKADAAALCVTCDFHIHSVNPFAQRHHRVPIEPFYGSASEFISNTSNVVSALSLLDGCDEFVQSNDDWVLLKSVNDVGLKNEEFLFDEVDPFLGFDFANGVHHQQEQLGNDGVVPATSLPLVSPPVNDGHVHVIPDSCFDIDFSQSNISTTFNSVSHNSVSSTEVGVVPVGNSVSEISFSNQRNVSESSSGSGSRSDREARVMRYREKRKNRKFEKTIRYASRKAYAETRPRIKGRFVKRAEIEPVYMSSSNSYGIVPSYLEL